MKSRLSDTARGWWPARRRLQHAPDHDRIMAAARLERHGGLAAIYLAGSPYEMGYQHGVLAKDLIRGFRRDAFAYMAPQIPVPKWLARPLLFHHTAAYWPTIPSTLYREMLGIAHGAGVHPIEVLLSTVIWEIFHAHGCSQFASVNAGDGAGTLIHGYNYDLMDPDHALIQPYLALVFYRPDHGIPFVTLNTAGSVGVNGGMNAAGLSVAWDNTYLKDSTLTGRLDSPVVPFIVILRQLLQDARSLDQAIQTVLDALPRPLADTIIIGSAQEGRAVALETAGRRHALRELEQGSIWSTNCFRSPELAPFDRRGDGGELTWRERWRRFPRYSAYEELFHGLEASLSPAAAAALLRDPYPREASGYRHPVRGSGSTICRDITSWSLVMEPGQGRIWASDAGIPGSQGRLYAFDLEAWTPLPDLDIPGTGFRAANEAARAFLERETARCVQVLEEAIQLDGATAPLMLMQALLAGQAGDEEHAAGHLRSIVDRWPGTPAAALASTWLTDDADAEVKPLPFPSAIHPVLLLGPAVGWKERAARAGRPSSSSAVVQ